MSDETKSVILSQKQKENLWANIFGKIHSDPKLKSAFNRFWLEIIEWSLHDPKLQLDKRYGMDEAVETLQNLVIKYDAAKTTYELEIEETSRPPSYQRALEVKNEILWTQLGNTTLAEEISRWLSRQQNPHTKRAYCTAMNELAEKDFIDPSMTLQKFSLYSPDIIIDEIKAMDVICSKTGKAWTTATKEARISAFLAFTRYLQRQTQGIIRKAIPSRDGADKTFSKKTDEVKTSALTRKQLRAFMQELEAINLRDALIAKLCAHGGKRIAEVLSLTTDQIDFETKRIRFKQSKTGGAEKHTIINFNLPSSEKILLDLKMYIGDRKGIVFVSKNGNAIAKNQIDRNFLLAGKRANIPYRMSPHVLRATAVTLWKEDGYQDSDVQKATGHSDINQLRRYDKTDKADNVTAKTTII